MSRTEYKWFWAWQYEEEEIWLNDMAAQGWLLERVGLCRYTFAKCEQDTQTVRLLLMDSWPFTARGQEAVRRIEQENHARYLGRVARWAYFAGPKDFAIHKTADAWGWHNQRVMALVRIPLILFVLCWVQCLLTLLRVGGVGAAVLLAVLSVLILQVAGGLNGLANRKKRLAEMARQGIDPAEERTVHKWIWVWQFEEEDLWLNQMAAQGWVLEEVGFCRYTFRKCQPGEYTVRLQFQQDPLSADYVQFVESTGAEYIGCMAAKWLYFRKKTADGPFALFSDLDSRIRQLTFIVRMLTVVGCLNLAVGGVNLWLGLNGNAANGWAGLGSLAATLLLVYAGSRIWQKRSKLQQQRTLQE